MVNALSNAIFDGDTAELMTRIESVGLKENAKICRVSNSHMYRVSPKII